MAVVGPTTSLPARHPVRMKIGRNGTYIDSTGGGGHIKDVNSRANPLTAH